MANAQAGQNAANLNSTVPIPFDAHDDPNGGNSLTQNLNVYYRNGDIAWMLTATALVLLMIPGVG
jgi:ammonium transporter, Amt family